MHEVPLLTQGAELGGPIFVSLVLVAANLGIAEPLLAYLERRPVNRRLLIGCAGVFAANMAYGGAHLPDRCAHGRGR